MLSDFRSTSGDDGGETEIDEKGEGSESWSCSGDDADDDNGDGDNDEDNDSLFERSER